jgi:hypothetical protein
MFTLNTVAPAVTKLTLCGIFSSFSFCRVGFGSCPDQPFQPDLTKPAHYEKNQPRESRAYGSFNLTDGGTFYDAGNGTGKKVKKDGNNFVVEDTGGFVDEWLSGFGRRDIFYKNRLIRRLEGEFKNDKPNGHVKLTLFRGDKITLVDLLTFRDGEKEGVCFETGADGNRRWLKYDSNKLVEQIQAPDGKITEFNAVQERTTTLVDSILVTLAG